MPDNNRPVGGQGFPADNPDGTPALIGKDDYTRQLLIDQANKDSGKVVLAGNFADLQRLGADVVQSGGGTGAVAKAVDNPVHDVTGAATISPAEQEAARGEYTRETERTGLLSAPVLPDPPKDTSPKSIDPTSVSPQPQTPPTPKSGGK